MGDGRLFRPQISFNIAYAFASLIIQYIQFVSSFFNVPFSRYRSALQVLNVCNVFAKHLPPDVILTATRTYSLSILYVFTKRYGWRFLICSMLDSPIYTGVFGAIDKFKVLITDGEI